MENLEWGKIIKNMRTNKKISLKKIADHLNFPISKLRDIEDGKEKITPQDLQSFFEYFNLIEDDIPNYQNEMDPKVVGAKLRRYRKMKKISLQDIVRDGIFSLGKLSSIENGSMIRVNVDDIKIICDYIGIPIDLIFDCKRKERVEDIKKEILHAKEYLINNHIDSALTVLESVASELKDKDLDEIKSYYEIVMGYYYLKSSNLEQAKQYLVQGTAGIVPDDENHELFVQAIHALTYIAFLQQKYIEAFEFAQKAVNVMDRFLINKDDQGITYFNLALTCLLMGMLDDAVFYANQAYEKANKIMKYDISFLLSFIYVVKEEYAPAQEKLREVTAYYRRINATSRYTRSLKLGYHLYKQFPTKYKYEINLMENRIPKEIFPKSIQEVDNYLDLIHLVIYHAIEDDNLELAQKRIKDCKRVEFYFPTMKSNFKTHFLDAQLLKKQNPEKVEEQRKALEKALDYFENEECDIKATLLTLLYELDEAYQESPLLKVNQMYLHSLMVQNSFQKVIFIRSMVLEPLFHL